MSDQQYTLTQTVAPTVAPVSLDKAKRHCFVDLGFGADDDLFADMIGEALKRFERVAARQLVTATYVARFDRWPFGCGGAIVIPMPPLIAVSSVAYVDTATGSTQTLSASGYQVDAYSQPGRIMPSWGNVWPSARDQWNAIAITYTAGYGGASAVPADMRGALLSHVAYCYQNRDSRDEDFLDNLFRPFWHGWRF